MILITNDPLDPELLTLAVRRDSNGAAITFLGVTRDRNEGRSVEHLEYEAYPDMAEKQIVAIFVEVQERWGITDLAVAHRLGRLQIGEISLVVAVASRHRRSAFEACIYVVDRIKQDVPIWKKEIFLGGEMWVGSEGHVSEEIVSPSV